MIIDWNWFFSSFCQSSAALIGIIGAFIISRLLGLSEKISSAISVFDNLVIEANRIIASISKRRFYWYTKTNVKYDSDLKDAIRKGDFDKLSKEEILKKLYNSNSRLYKNDDAVMEAFNEVFEANSPSRAQTELGGGFSMLHNSSISLDIPPIGIWDKLSKERETINNLEIEARTIIQHFEQNLQDLNSFDDTIKPLKVIIIMLMIAFPITVIYPLHFMPVTTNEDPTITLNLLTIIKSFLSIKSVLLLAFFATIEGIFLYFLILTNQLNSKLRTATQNKSDDMRNIKTYSQYFDDEQGSN
jgi:hypothetical protein